jgi:O-antigen/teichoic acid export membrane protein
MLGYFRTSAEVGLYSAAYPLATGLGFILQSFGFIYLPLASRMDSQNDSDSIDRVYKITTKWIFILTVPLFTIFFAFPESILNVVFGRSYGTAAITLSILSIGFFTSAAAGRNRETISAIGRTKLILIINTTAFVVNILLNLVLIPRYGHVGAAISSAISFVLLNIMACTMLWYAHQLAPANWRTVKLYVLILALLVPVNSLLSTYFDTILVVLVMFCVNAFAAVSLLVLYGLEAEDEHLIGMAEKKSGIDLGFIKRHVRE